MLQKIAAIVMACSVAVANISAEATVCPPPSPTSTGDVADDCRDVFRVECPVQGQVLSGFRVKDGDDVGVVTALHGVLGCFNSNLTAFNLRESYRDLRIYKVDIAFDVALLTSPLLQRSGDGLQTTRDFEGRNLRVVGYPQGLSYQFSHRVEPHIPPLRPLRTTLGDAELRELERRRSPDVSQTILSLSGAIQNGYSGAPILTWEGQVVAVVNGGLRSGSVDIGWAMPWWSLRLQGARQSDLASIASDRHQTLFGIDASPRSTLPRFYLSDGGEPVGRIYEVLNNRLRVVYQRPTGRLYSLAVAPNGTLYFSDHNDNYVYRLDGRREVRVFAHSTYTRDIKFDRQGRLYFSEATGAGADGLIYRLQGGRAEVTFRVHLSEVDGFWAGNFGFDREGVLWLSSGNRVPASLFKVVGGHPRRMFTSGGSITGLAFTERGDLLYADWRQRVQRVELPGFLASEALHSPAIKWASDIAVPPSGTGRKPNVPLPPRLHNGSPLPQPRRLPLQR